MNTHYTYALILAGSIIGPLALSFDKKVAYHLQWKKVFISMLIPAVFYLIWDIWFTQKAVWSFNAQYITGIRLYNLPIEEVMFFFVVPFCCVFIYLCVKTYFPKITNNQWSERFLWLSGIIMLIIALIHRHQDYTFYTFMLNAVLMMMLFIFRKKYFQHINISLFLLSYLIILIPFLVVNGLLTSIPVVIYNDAENLGIRIWTIPVEDIFYGLLLIWGNVLGYEYSNKLHK